MALRISRQDGAESVADPARRWTTPGSGADTGTDDWRDGPLDLLQRFIAEHVRDTGSAAPSNGGPT